MLQCFKNLHVTHAKCYAQEKDFLLHYLYTSLNQETSTYNRLFKKTVLLEYIDE